LRNENSIGKIRFKLLLQSIGVRFAGCELSNNGIVGTNDLETEWFATMAQAKKKLFNVFSGNI